MHMWLSDKLITICCATMRCNQNQMIINYIHRFHIIWEHVKGARGMGIDAFDASDKWKKKIISVWSIIGCGLSGYSDAISFGCLATLAVQADIHRTCLFIYFFSDYFLITTECLCITVVTQLLSDLFRKKKKKS